ncbi:hypothetical protein FRB99_004945 [Tulasnella sp. 403]|nr:hypothetical protein FRB99_004945 [Tulasnella sp. 403]
MSPKVDLGTITVDAEELVSGAKEPGMPWSATTSTKLYTNCFIIDEKNQRILLGYKKRGFGKGMYNGFGGKVDANEAPYDAALRELKEEAGISSVLAHAGTLLFTSGDSSLMHHIEIYRGLEWGGEIVETEEMRPEWFRVPEFAYDSEEMLKRMDDPRDISGGNTVSGDGSSGDLASIPFEKMWYDDRLWFPFLLKKRPFVGRVDFGVPTEEGVLDSAPMIKWWFGEPRTTGPLV